MVNRSWEKNIPLPFTHLRDKIFSISLRCTGLSLFFVDVPYQLKNSLLTTSLLRVFIENT